MSGTKTTRSATLADINAIRVSKLFRGNMAVTVDTAADEVSIVYISTVGVTKNTVLKAPTMAEFGAAIEAIAKDAHQAALGIMNERGAMKGAFAKAIALKSFREPQGQALQDSNHDTKTAAELNANIIQAAKDKKAADEARLAKAKQAVIDAEATIKELEA